MTGDEENKDKVSNGTLATNTDPESIERGNWTGKFDFLLSCLGYAVGLGNVWRFPYLCFKHGGGAFLVPYVIMLCCLGIPLFLLELVIGQYSGMGVAHCYSNLSPLFAGLGVTNILISSFVALYYNMIIAWAIYYFFASFTSELPWEKCDGEFNSAFCFSIGDFKNCTTWRNESGSTDIIYHNGRCLSNQEDLEVIRNNLTFFYGCQFEAEEGSKVPGIFINESYCAPVQDAAIKELFDIPFSIRKTAAQEYLEDSVLKKTSGIDVMGPVEWHLALCLLAAWIIIFLCLIKGIKSSGKVVYFTATFPYLILIILFFRAVTLPGASDGVRFYMVPDWSKLGDIKVWEGAAVQIFFSLSVAGGGLLTFASYNKFHNNIIRDTLIVCLGNCFTSVFAGFAIFSVLGFLALELGVPVDSVVKGGSGLAFIAYPDLVTRLPGAPFWALSFFFMLFLLGLDSQFAIVECVFTGVLDFMPSLRRHKIIVIGVICCVGFICGLPLATGGGSYLLELLDYYAAGWPYLIVGLSELVIMAYVYGMDNFFKDIQDMTNYSPSTWFRSHLVVFYSTIGPLLVLVVLCLSWAHHEPLEQPDGTPYPKYADTIGWFVAMVPIVSIPLVALWKVGVGFFVTNKHERDIIKRLGETIKQVVSPTREWRLNAMKARQEDKEEKQVVSNEAFDNMALEKDG